MNHKTLFAILAFATMVVIGYAFLASSSDPPEFIQRSVPVETDPVQVQYVGKVKFDNVSVRLLVLKHCFESMADGDARLAIQAANLAADRGLRIRDIGNHYINQEGQTNRRAVWGETVSLPGLKSFISEQMKVNAEPGDTIIVFTIGHGARSGYLQMLGDRGPVFHAIAQAAKENNQETLWWQLSCYASAGLPNISELSPAEQDVFSVLASSNATRESPAYVEGKHMEKVFLAMADKSREIDPDADESITAKELKDFLNNKVERGRGDLLYARSEDEVIFGAGSIAQRIPIVDRNNPQQQYPRNYIPLPRR